MPSSITGRLGKGVEGKSSYTQAVGDDICDRISTGQSLKSICRETGIQERTVLRWVRDIEPFCQQYTRAREEQADADADAVNDVGSRVLSGEIDPQAARVVIDALKWSAGKRNAKKYGDRLALDHAGTIASVSEEELDARIAKLAGQAGIAVAAGGKGEAEGA